jgi:hypothetical protein
MERETLAFEAALIELRGGELRGGTSAASRGKTGRVDAATRELTAARAAAASGIYQSDQAGGRTPLALQLPTILNGRRAELEKALAKTRAELKTLLDRTQSGITAALEERKAKLERELAGVRSALKPVEQKLQAPGLQLI